MSSMTSLTTTEVFLRVLFALYGIPEDVVSDNGPHNWNDDVKMKQKRNRNRRFQTSKVSNLK